MELYLIGLQNAGKASLVNVIAITLLGEVLNLIPMVTIIEVIMMDMFCDVFCVQICAEICVRTY